MEQSDHTDNGVTTPMTINNDNFYGDGLGPAGCTFMESDHLGGDGVLGVDVVVVVVVVVV